MVLLIHYFVDSVFSSGNPIDAGLQLTDRSYADISMGGLKPLERVERLPKPWQKFPNSKCKVPSEFLFALNSGERGCSSIRFSHNGFFLACAEVNKAQENHRITIFEVSIRVLHLVSFE